MKIYIDNLPQYKLSKTEKCLLEQYSTKETTYSQLFSPDGIYIIEPSHIYRMDSPNYHNIEKHSYKSLSLVMDKSEYAKTRVTSQLPVEYIAFKMTKTEYFTDKKSVLSMVIEKSECNLMPPQIYFVTNEKTNILDMLDNFFITNELDEFLLCFYPQ